ncbi:hypothetical protein BD413DRAFT_610467 [Trametes elegans]|nr:hypothetical protein BD413DRAFT_610467 [Trametes elegans]
MSTSHTSSLSPSRSPTPELPLQPDHFYGNEDVRFPPSPNSDGRTWLDPTDDPLAQRGIPVFKPSMDEFEDFEAYMTRVEPWGMRSGIVKIIPPKEWSDALPSVVPQLDKVKLKSPIEQHMFGQGGLFQQRNIEKRRALSVREWAEMCAKDEFRAPGVDEVGLHARATNGGASSRTRTRRGRKNRESETAEPADEGAHDAESVVVKREEEDEEHVGRENTASVLISPPNSHRDLSPEERQAENAAGPPSKPLQSQYPQAEEEEEGEGEGKGEDDAKQSSRVDSREVGDGPGEEEEVKPKVKGRRATQTREAREAMMAERAAKDSEFLHSFDPHTAWLPPKTTAASYTPEFCKELERRYWRNCGFGKPAWYGADMQGSLFTDETKSWNVAHLPSALTRLLPASNKGLPGVNTPYLYFGMWRATFAWHVEDMDLFSINYIHFGAPKFWYAIPQARANALEQSMRSLFPGAGKNCSQFLRHKSYLASPTHLNKFSCHPNYLVQHAGEFVITFPRGYHAGFNLGLNCAESVNFALESWIEIGKKAKACGCVNFSVRIDVDQLLRDRAAEKREVFRKAKKPRKIKSEDATEKENKSKPAKKRKSDGDAPIKAKKPRTKQPSIAFEQPVASSSKVQLPPAPSPPSKLVKVTLKLPPKPKEPEGFPCCLCVSTAQEELLRVQDPPGWWYEPGNREEAGGRACMAHAECASVVPETWVDEIEVGDPDENGVRRRERVVFGVDGIVKDRWNLKCTACTKTKNRTHGAPIQCTKGKCPKAFHVSCARDGHANGIVFKVLREVEKEVVLLDSQSSANNAQPPQSTTLPAYSMPSDPSGVDSTSDCIDPALIAEEHTMDIDSYAMHPAPSMSPQSQMERQYQGSPSPQVLKVIKKTEVEVLCHQHNPTIQAAKKAQQQDRIRNQLTALPPMSRIKLRVTAGVFEVTLLRVLEDIHSVEVLWDRGLKREFKWRSVVFGDTEAVVGQKPTEAAPPELQLGPPSPTKVTMRVSYPPTGSSQPPSYRSSPAVHSQSHSHPQSHSNSPMPCIGPSTHSSPPTHTSPPPAASGSTTQHAAAPVCRPPSAQPVYAQQQPYQPPTSTYQYAPGSWTYQYPGAPYASGSNQHYGGPSGQPPPSAPYQASSAAAYPTTSYPRAAYGHPGASPYQYSYGRHAYGPYGHYGGGYPYVPPPSQPSTSIAAQPQPQTQTQTQAPASPSVVAPSPTARPASTATSAPSPAPSVTPGPPLVQGTAQPPPQAQTQSRGLQWQAPYTGPKTVAKGPPLTTATPAHYNAYGTGQAYTPAPLPPPPPQRSTEAGSTLSVQVSNVSAASISGDGAATPVQVGSGSS